jgi:hypothetical protein
MILRSLLFFLVYGVFINSGMAQYGNRIYITDPSISPADSHQLFLRFRNATFLNNKEFFNPYQPGYTLIGYFARPMLEYHPGPATRLKAGIHLLKYSGQEKFSRYIPVFSFQHRFTPGLEMVFGALHGTLNHGLIEPLFSFERIFTHHHESGLQFLIDLEWFRADVWIDWERFIFTGDPFQEEFTAGLSSRFFPWPGEGRWRIEIPVQLLTTHLGGQIDVSGERVQTLVNYATGIHADFNTGHPFFRIVGFRGYYAGFLDLSNETRHHYEQGWGIYPNLYVDTRWLEAGIGYWRGHRFVAPRGEPVFQSVSRVDPDLAVDQRELITSKIIYNRRLVRGIDMGLRFEVYYDPAGGDFDHTGGLHIMINERFFITRLKRNQ